MDLDTIAKIITVLGSVFIVATQIRAYFDGSNSRKIIKESDDIFIGRIDVQEKALDRLTKEVERKNLETERYRDDFEKLDTKFSALRIDFDTERGKLNALIGDLEDDRDKLRAQNETLSNRVAIGDSNYQTVSNQLATLQTAYAELQKKYESLLAIVQSKDGELSKLSDENKVYADFFLFLGMSEDIIMQIKQRKYEVYNEWKTNSRAVGAHVQEPEVPSSVHHSVGDTPDPQPPGTSATS